MRATIRSCNPNTLTHCASGFARRYFILYHSGILSYSVEPGQPARDHILLPQAAISTAQGRKDIHIDSDNATFHIKCLNTEDFYSWMGAFRYAFPQLSSVRGVRQCEQEIHGAGCGDYWAEVVYLPLGT